MSSKIKTIIISVIIVIALILAYVFLFKKSPSQSNLTSISPTGVSLPNTNIVSTQNIPVDTDFINVLLSIQNIKLNDAIFSSTAFTSLRDSSIILTPDGTEGRKNPFAPIGIDTTTSTNPESADTTENTSGSQTDVSGMPGSN